MPKVSRESAQAMRQGPVEDRRAEVDGGWTVDFLTFDADIDATELLEGLPDDRCPCPHWGYVFQGRVTFQTEHGEEIHEAGDAVYLPPGHVPAVTAGTEYLQFSPTDQLTAVSEHMMHRAAGLQGAV